ncbi:MAG: Ldh family oxidoreductase [Clostridia bacterium]
MNGSKFHWKELERVVADVFCGAGVPLTYARVAAESLVHADLRGIESHGVSRLPIYVKRIESGLLDTRNEPRIMMQDGATALVDGGNQLGAIVGMRALEQAAVLSRQYGIGLVGVRHSNHFGSCSFYADRAIKEGLILLVLSNAPQAMAPTGGRKPFFGTNPLAIGIPTKQEPPFLLDMATSVVARGKIALAAKGGKSIPAHWAIDQAGAPTTDPKQALLGSVLPIGGPKGYGMAMFIDILCGVLTGAAYGPGVCSLYENETDPQNVGHFFLAIDINRFMPRDEFCAGMDAYIREIKAIPRAEGVEEIFIPGEMERRNMHERTENGIPLNPEILEELAQVCHRYGVDLDSARVCC